MKKTIKELYIKIKNSSIIDILFYIGVGIFAFSRVYEYSTLIELTKSIKSVLRILSFGFLLPKVVFQDYDKKDIPMVLMLYVYTIVCICFSKDKNTIILPTLLVGCKGINIRKVINIIFTVLLSALVIHCVAFMVVYTKTNGDFLSMFHLSSHPVKNIILYRDNNMYGFRFACCTMLYIYLTDRNKDRYLKSLILFLLSIFMLLLCQSRTSFIMIVMAIGYLLFENNIFNKLNMNVVKYVVVVLSIIISFMLPIIGSNKEIFLFGKINILLSNRPAIYNTAINVLGIHLLPNIKNFDNVSNMVGSYTRPDNSYISTLLRWGIILTVLIALITYLLIRKEKDKLNNYYICIMAICFIVEYASIRYMLYALPLIVSNSYFNNIKQEKME